MEKVLSNGQAIVYVYDAFGNLAEEWSPYNAWSKDYIWFGGQVAATQNASSSPCTTCYFSYDHLGSVRLVTDQNANVMARHDFLPFGEEVFAGTAGRNGQYGAFDSTSQRFTGQSGDSKTQLDFFNARYFLGGLGRFNSPDPANAGAVLTDPQTWNGYAYVRNNPLNAINPSGLAPEYYPGPGDDWLTGGGNPTDGCAFLDSNDASCQSPPTYVEPGIPIYPGGFPGGGGGGGNPSNGGTGGAGSGSSGSAQNGDPVPCAGGNYSALFPAILAPGFLFSTTVTSTPLDNGRRPNWLNNIASIFGYDQNIPLKSCLVEVALRTAANDLNPFTPGAFDVGQGALRAGQAMKCNQALTYAAGKGLTYPFKSSVFRSILNASKLFGKVADTLPLANLDYALTDGLIAEIRAMNQGECQ